jgi:GH25 family lysozyme M1 (1,4-beta-N-acetylmuramidase)
VYIDTESSGRAGRADNLDVATRTAVCDAFCKTIEAAGERGGIYASRNWFYNQLDTSKLAGASIWLAEYRKAPLYEGYYQMWQYTSRGSVNGIEGNVDLDICYPDQPIE